MVTRRAPEAGVSEVDGLLLLEEAEERALALELQPAGAVDDGQPFQGESDEAGDEDGLYPPAGHHSGGSVGRGAGGSGSARLSKAELHKSRPKPPRPEGQASCPRCASTDTKFCYYNNYNVKQPRYFCKACQRYWTQGGTLRNVPPGSGRRKSKSAVAKHHSQQAQLAHQALRGQDAADKALAEQLAKQSAAAAHHMLANPLASGLAAAAVPFLGAPTGTTLLTDPGLLAYNAALTSMQQWPTGMVPAAANGALLGANGLGGAMLAGGGGGTPSAGATTNGGRRSGSPYSADDNGEGDSDGEGAPSPSPAPKRQRMGLDGAAANGGQDVDDGQDGADFVNHNNVVGGVNGSAGADVLGGDSGLASPNGDGVVGGDDGGVGVNGGGIAGMAGHGMVLLPNGGGMTAMMPLAATANTVGTSPNHLLSVGAATSGTAMNGWATAAAQDPMGFTVGLGDATGGMGTLKHVPSNSALNAALLQQQQQQQQQLLTQQYYNALLMQQQQALSAAAVAQPNPYMHLAAAYNPFTGYAGAAGLTATSLAAFNPAAATGLHQWGALANQAYMTHAAHATTAATPIMSWPAHAGGGALADGGMMAGLLHGGGVQGQLMVGGEGGGGSPAGGVVGGL